MARGLTLGSLREVDRGSKHFDILVHSAYLASKISEDFRKLANRWVVHLNFISCFCCFRPAIQPARETAGAAVDQKQEV